MTTIRPLYLKARDLGFWPYAPVITDDGRTLEAISFPFEKEDGSLWIMARELGDPTTMERYALPTGEIADLLKDEW